MALDFISKHGIIIGTVTIIAGLALIILQIPRVYYIFDIDYRNSSYFHSIQYVIENVGMFIMGLLAIILSTLLIFGIIKRCDKLLRAWLVVAYVTLVISSCFALYFAIIGTRFYVNDFTFGYVLIAAQVVLMHPIHNLYLEIRKENSIVNCK